MVQEWLNCYLQSVEELRADPEGSAELLFDFEEEEGISMTEAAAKRDIETRIFPSLEENQKAFAEDAEGNISAQEDLLKFADFMISQGKLTEADKQAMIDNKAVDGTFMANVKLD